MKVNKEILECWI